MCYTGFYDYMDFMIIASVIENFISFTKQFYNLLICQR